MLLMLNLPRLQVLSDEISKKQKVKQPEFTMPVN